MGGKVDKKFQEASRITNDARKKFNVPKSYEIKERTIRRRVNQKHLHTIHRCKASPITKVEDLLFEMASQKANMNQPVTIAEGIILANSLIKGIEIEDRVMDYYQERKYFDDEDEYCDKQNGEEQKSSLRAGYWSEFMHWYGHKIVTKRGRKFAKR